ncbi:hypothetical protein [Alteromonas oceanisediminis]|uniref:hypothetical protein n=1 Tax=Alteromonas oceanisediminis TaxID=2836180 RepID=UPI001BD991F8|nr:hypothetical protein [Alteromonas oceanisediminis]MBT0586291.1 hypothetical protein [Alteromonas oceanisediminis]
MRLLSILFFVLISHFDVFAGVQPFDKQYDLLVLQFDSKTDADDLHSIAAASTILKKVELPAGQFIAVAGAYGIQGGLYIHSPVLFDRAFENNWIDAHSAPDRAISVIEDRVKSCIKTRCRVWVMEAGQSDLTSLWLKRVVSDKQLAVDIKTKIIIVQHSEWNEEQTHPSNLEYVKKHANYIKIPDGNAFGNGTPGFNDVNSEARQYLLSNHGETWKIAIDLAEKYNGLNERYSNQTIHDGGLDFSDAAELIWILGIRNIEDIDGFIRWTRMK